MRRAVIRLSAAFIGAGISACSGGPARGRRRLTLPESDDPADLYPIGTATC
jgi:hypothetical protein